MIKQKGQLLIFVLMLLSISAILAFSLANGWQSEISARGLTKDNLRAFYIAQAGLEYAKVRFAYNETLVNFSGNFSNGNYTVNVTPYSCPTKNKGKGFTTDCDCCRLVSVGRFGNSQKTIRVNITLDADPCSAGAILGDEEQDGTSWFVF